MTLVEALRHAIHLVNCDAGLHEQIDCPDLARESREASEILDLHREGIEAWEARCALPHSNDDYDEAWARPSLLDRLRWIRWDRVALVFLSGVAAGGIIARFLVA